MSKNVDLYYLKYILKYTNREHTIYNYTDSHSRDRGINEKKKERITFSNSTCKIYIEDAKLFPRDLFFSYMRDKNAKQKKRKNPESDAQ